jgi:hypothetical protein
MVAVVTEVLGLGAGVGDGQPAPEPNDSRPIWEMVIEDMEERNRVGAERYGTPLQAFNGRKSLQDLYEELLDAVVYLRTHIEEAKARG